MGTRDHSVKQTVNSESTDTQDDEFQYKSTESNLMRNLTRATPRLTPDTILQLQQTIGNQAVQRLLKENATSQPTIIQRGNTPPSSSGSGKSNKHDNSNEVSSGSIQFVADKPPKWKNQGRFQLKGRFRLNNGQAYGTIIQKVENYMQVGDDVLQATYWEAWPFDDEDGIEYDGQDHWIRTEKGSGTKGNWWMRGTVYVVKNYITDYSYGFEKGSVKYAHGLLATENDPGGELDMGEPLMTRYADGKWRKSGYHKGNYTET